MTGFGESSVQTKSGRISIEVKSLNNRFLEIQVRSPKALSTAEANIREAISKHIKRGTVYVNLFIKDNLIDTTDSELDAKTLARLAKHLRSVNKSLKLDENLNLDNLIKASHYFSKESAGLEINKSWKLIKKPLSSAIKKLMDMRAREGKKLKVDMEKIILNCRNSLKIIEKESPKRIKEYKKRLKHKIVGLAANAAVEDARIALEIGVMAEKLDISEECARLKSHFQQFMGAMESRTSKGKRLNFLLQEMNREANTIGSKANNAKIAHQSVYLKEQIETIREQIQNIE